MTTNQIEEFEKSKKLMLDLTVDIIEVSGNVGSVLTIAENIEIPIEKITPDLDRTIAEANTLIAEGNKISTKVDADLVKAQLYASEIKPYIENINVEDINEDKKLNEIINKIEKMRLDFNKSMLELKKIGLDLEKKIEYIKDNGLN